MWSTKNSKYSWPKTYSEITKYHNQAFHAIDEAISLEEQENPREVSDIIFNFLLST